MRVNTSASSRAASGVGTSAIYLWTGLKPTVKQALADSFGGEIGIAAWIAGFAPVVDAKFESLTGNLPGVFHYEVVEEMGCWLGNNPQAADEQFKDQLDHLTALFIAQGQG